MKNLPGSVRQTEFKEIPTRRNREQERDFHRIPATYGLSVLHCVSVAEIGQWERGGTVSPTVRSLANDALKRVQSMIES